MSFIFIDILSNTIIARPDTGIGDPNCQNAVFTTTSKGNIILDISEKGTGRRLALTGSIKRGVLRKLDQPLWLMGNTSVGHSKKYLKGEDIPFAVIFDPAEVNEALDIPPADISITENTLFPGLAEPEISKAICFPYAQHYIADSPGCYTTVTDRDDLVGKYNKLAASERFVTFSSRTIVKQLVAGVILSVLLAVSLVLIFS